MMLYLIIAQEVHINKKREREERTWALRNALHRKYIHLRSVFKNLYSMITLHLYHNLEKLLAPNTAGGLILPKKDKKPKQT